MKRQTALWTILIILLGAGIYILLRSSDSGTTLGSSPAAPPAYSLVPRPMGLLNGGAGYVFDTTYAYATSDTLPTEELIAPIQRFLDQQDNPDLTVGQLREFRWAYQVEIIERSTGRPAFGLMLSKGTAQISPKAGPNVFWNTKYGSQIAEIGGGYGMVGRLLPQEASPEATLTEADARQIAESAVTEVDAAMALNDDVAAYYGFYEFYAIRDGNLVGELDVNVYNDQVWYKDWGEPQLDVVHLNVGD